MSQKNSSPKTPLSNSPSCHDVTETESEENQRPRSALDRLQRQVEEELRQSNQLLVAIDGLIGNTSENFFRPRSAQDENSHSLRKSTRTWARSEVCPPLTQTLSACNEGMEDLDLPFPLQSTFTCGSRGHDESRGGSKRGTRFPFPEKFSLNSVSRTNSLLTLANQDSQNVNYGLDENRDWSSTIYAALERNNEGMPFFGGKTSGTSLCSQEQLSFNENKSLSKKSFKSSPSRYLNESSELQPHSTSCHGRGTRTSSPVEEIIESNQNPHSVRSRSPALGTKTQFLTYDEDKNYSKIGSARSRSPALDTKTQFSTYDEDKSYSKTGHDHYHNDESPHDFLRRDEKATAALGHLSQLRKTPSYYRCNLQQGTEFLNVCCPKVKEATTTEGKIVKLPQSPCLRPEDIDELIKCEASDVESAWYLTSEEKKTHKKPCPKQQKAQLTVKSIVQTYTTQTGGVQIYAPLDHPDPEDISPEVAAAMMFSQEQGIRMEECPNAVIAHLFPDEPTSTAPEKGSVSIVDPNQKDQEEMIEKSAAVPSEGVSDSAYTRIMREKGDDMKLQRPYDLDFAVCQSKPEYVLVTQKPQRVSKVQFRGNLPSWFPGYFSAFPDDEGLKVVSSPSGLFHKAWVYSNPENIPASDVIVLE